LSEQAAALGHSCGAVDPSLFAQIFKETIDGRPKHRLSLVFIFVIGDTKRRMPREQEQPEMLDWLHKDEGSMSSALVRCTRELVDMPRWEQDEDSDNKDLMLLGDVKQQVTNIQLWKPRIHQLVLYVGTPRQGHGATQRVREHSAARKGQYQRQVTQRWS